MLDPNSLVSRWLTAVLTILLYPDLKRALSTAMRPGSYQASTVDNFLTFYHFCFELLKPEGKKYVEKDMGCAALLAIWTQVPGKESPHIDSFVEFLNANEKILSINQDQWKSFVQFSKQVLVMTPLMSQHALAHASTRFVLIGQQTCFCFSPKSTPSLRSCDLRSCEKNGRLTGA